MSNISVRQYSLNGFKIITLNTLFENIVLKYNSTRIILTNNGETIMDEPYSKERYRYAIEYINGSQYREYDEDVEEFRQDIEEFKNELDEFMGGFVRELSTIPKTVNTATYNVLGDNSWENLFNDVDGNPNTNHRPVNVSQKRGCGCFGGCLGCLVYAIILLAVVSLVFYGFGFLGMKIVDFFLSIF